MNFPLVIIGRLVSFVSKILNKGAGSTWPGHIALSLNSSFINQILEKSRVKIILVAGTNGKTTTGKMISEILRKNGKKVFQNTSGANLLNGIASSLIAHTSIIGTINYDYGIFEVDENVLPLAINNINPYCIVCLDLFRDQLDRYGELDSIAKKWKDSFMGLSGNSTLVLNADDPLISTLGEQSKAKTLFFGLGEKNNKNKIQHGSDSIYCPRCSEKLNYLAVTYSHLGNWACPNCKLKRPNYNTIKLNYPLPGIYNQYNAQAAAIFANNEGLKENQINLGLKNLTPVFGRQETIDINGKKVQIFLSKNPTSFNQSLETISEKRNKKIIFVLNDRIPDGRDVSWIWDIDIEKYIDNFGTIITAGDRCYDMALRINYAKKTKLYVFENLEEAIKFGIDEINQSETLYILPTYSAMLEVRKILTGKKIL